MHMEPGIVDGSKLLLSYATASACALYATKLSLDHIRHEGAVSLLLRSVLPRLVGQEVPAGQRDGICHLSRARHCAVGLLRGPLPLRPLLASPIAAGRELQLLCLPCS